MKKIILALFLVLSFNFFCFAENKPADPNLWDFGTVKAGQVLSHEFTLKNESKKQLNIKNVGTSCGCTVSEAGKKVLLPGESTIIKVKFDSRGYSGEVKQHVYVNTDNLDNSLIRFVIKANVVK